MSKKSRHRKGFILRKKGTRKIRGGVVTDDDFKTNTTDAFVSAEVVANKGDNQTCKVEILNRISGSNAYINRLVYLSTKDLVLSMIREIRTEKFTPLLKDAPENLRILATATATATAKGAEGVANSLESFIKHCEEKPSGVDTLKAKYNLLMGRIKLVYDFFLTMTSPKKTLTGDNSSTEQNWGNIHTAIKAAEDGFAINDEKTITAIIGPIKVTDDAKRKEALTLPTVGGSITKPKVDAIKEMVDCQVYPFDHKNLGIRTIIGNFDDITINLFRLHLRLVQSLDKFIISEFTLLKHIAGLGDVAVKSRPPPRIPSVRPKPSVEPNDSESDSEPTSNRKRRSNLQAKGLLPSDRDEELDNGSGAGGSDDELDIGSASGKGAGGKGGKGAGGKGRPAPRGRGDGRGRVTGGRGNGGRGGKGEHYHNQDVHLDNTPGKVVTYESPLINAMMTADTNERDRRTTLKALITDFRVIEEDNSSFFIANDNIDDNKTIDDRQLTELEAEIQKLTAKLTKRTNTSTFVSKFTTFGKPKNTPNRRAYDVFKSSNNNLKHTIIALLSNRVRALYISNMDPQKSRETYTYLLSVTDDRFEINLMQNEGDNPHIKTIKEWAYTVYIASGKKIKLTHFALHIPIPSSRRPIGPPPSINQETIVQPAKYIKKPPPPEGASTNDES